MNILFYVCIGLSFGVTGGFLVGVIKLRLHRNPSPARRETMKKLVDRIASALKYITLFLLCMGLIWCCYFLVLGAVQPAQADYANSMSELIVCVLTVISIIFAFIEFAKRSKDGK